VGRTKRVDKPNLRVVDSTSRKGDNDDRRNGKAYKKKPKENKKSENRKTVGGFSSRKMAERQERRKGRLLEGNEI
jgi:hypothetical protein